MLTIRTDHREEKEDPSPTNRENYSRNAGGPNHFVHNVISHNTNKTYSQPQQNFKENYNVCTADVPRNELNSYFVQNYNHVWYSNQFVMMNFQIKTVIEFPIPGPRHIKLFL